MIRAAGEKDLAAILSIENASFSDPWSEEMLRDLFFEPNGILVREEGEILGYVGFRHAFDEGEITTIAARGDARRRGVGSSLLAAALQRPASKGVRAVYLEVRASNEAAKKCYEKAGFSPVGRRKNYYECPKEDALLYRKDLDR